MDLLKVIDAAPPVFMKAHEMGLITTAIARKIKMFEENPGQQRNILPEIFLEIREETKKVLSRADEYDLICEGYVKEHGAFVKEFSALLEEEIKGLLVNFKANAAIKIFHQTEGEAVVIFDERYRSAIAQLYVAYRQNYKGFLEGLLQRMAQDLVARGYVKRTEMALSTSDLKLDFHNPPYQLTKADSIKPANVLQLLLHAIKAPFMGIFSIGIIVFVLFNVFPTQIIQGVLSENTWLYYLLVGIISFMFWQSLSKTLAASDIDFQKRLQAAYDAMRGHAEQLVGKDVKRFLVNITDVFDRNVTLILENNLVKNQRVAAIMDLRESIDNAIR